MDGSALAGILTIAVGGGHVDIDMDTGMDIIGDISMGTDMDIDMAMLRAEGPDTELRTGRAPDRFKAISTEIGIVA